MYIALFILLWSIHKIKNYYFNFSKWICNTDTKQNNTDGNIITFLNEINLDETKWNETSSLCSWIISVSKVNQYTKLMQVNTLCWKRSLYSFTLMMAFILVREEPSSRQRSNLFHDSEIPFFTIVKCLIFTLVKSLTKVRCILYYLYIYIICLGVSRF